MGRQVGERAIERSDRRAGRPNDDNVIFHYKSPVRLIFWRL